MKNLILLCGKPGCGKTTLAKFIKAKYGAVHFSADDFMLKLFGEIEDRQVFEEKLRKCKELIYEICDELAYKNDIVLDFGFWTKEERRYLVKRFPNFNVIFIYMKLNDDDIFERIEHRNKHLKENEYYMDKQTYKILSAKFEEVDKSEGNVYFVEKDTKIEGLDR